MQQAEATLDTLRYLPFFLVLHDREDGVQSPLEVARLHGGDPPPRQLAGLPHSEVVRQPLLAPQRLGAELAAPRPEAPERSSNDLGVLTQRCVHPLHGMVVLADCCKAHLLIAAQLLARPLEGPAHLADRLHHHGPVALEVLARKLQGTPVAAHGHRGDLAVPAGRPEGELQRPAVLAHCRGHHLAVGAKLIGCKLEVCAALRHGGQHGGTVPAVRRRTALEHRAGLLLDGHRGGGGQRRPLRCIAISCVSLDARARGRRIALVGQGSRGSARVWEADVPVVVASRRAAEVGAHVLGRALSLPAGGLIVLGLEVPRRRQQR
mmetsp:Transcript_70555/g.190776  ORF Transcript_70555/g.190776 Transcript_70555/m.190776 type:complete len:321 (+) Transcript_70555:111-1073(+)